MRKAAAAALLVVFAGCTETTELLPPGPAPPASSPLQIAPTGLTLAVGVASQLEAWSRLAPDAPRDVTAFSIWTSGDPDVAIVAQGRVVAVSPGTVTIQVASAGAVATVPVTVLAPPALAGLQAWPRFPTVARGQQLPLVAVGVYADGSVAPVSNATWSSDDPAIALADGQTLEGKSIGTTVVRARLGGFEARAIVDVSAAVLASLLVEPAAPALPAGGTLRPAAVGVFTDGSVRDLTAAVTWATDDARVAVVASGELRAVAQGQTRLLATASGVTAAVPVIVGPAALQAVAVVPGAFSLPKGGARQLVCLGTYTDGTTSDLTSSASWTSDSTPHVQVTGSGRAVAVDIGSARVSADIAGHTGRAVVSVTGASFDGVAISPTMPSVAAGEVIGLIATGLFSDGSSSDVTDATSWTTANADVAVVTANRLRGVAPGVTTVTASVQNVAQSATVTVGRPVLQGISVSPGAATIASGDAQAFTCTASYSDATTRDCTADASWTALLGGRQAPLPAPGSVSEALPGDYLVTASYSGLAGTATLNVTPPAVRKLVLTPSKVALPAGATVSLAARAVYSDGSTGDATADVDWSTDDAGVATFDGAQGLLHAIAPGATTAAAALGGVVATAAVAVGPAEVVSVQLTPPAVSVATGTLTQFHAVAQLTDGASRDVTATAQWSTSDATVAFVDDFGRVDALAVGTAIVGAASGAVLATAQLVVVAPALVQVAVAPANPSVTVGESLQLLALGTYADGSSKDVSSLASWTSSDVSVATVTPAGLARADGAGTALLSATVEGIGGSTTLLVEPAPLLFLTISPSVASLQIGGALQLAAVGQFADGTLAPLTSQATWTSSDSTVASVGDVPGSKGLVTPLWTGTATVTATLSGQVATAMITVQPLVPRALAIAPAGPTLEAGLTLQLTARATLGDGSTRDVTSLVLWGSARPTIAAFPTGAPPGLLTAVSPGTTNVSAVLGGVGAATTVTVVPRLVSLRVSPPAPVLGTAEMLSMRAYGSYSDGSVRDVTDAASWSSTKPLVAFVADTPKLTGRMYGLLQGVARISAMVGSHVASEVAEVAAGAPKTVVVSPGQRALPVGVKVGLRATATFGDGTVRDVTREVTWSSSAAAVTVNAAGGALGAMAGTATLTADFFGVRGTAQLTVTSATPTSLSLTPAAPGVPQGFTTRLRARATFSDGTAEDVTGLSTWATSDAGVATVVPGLCAGVSAGVATVSATYAGFSASAPLTVTSATLAGLAVSPASLVAPLHGAAALAAVASFTDGTSLYVTTAATWSSSSAAVVVLDAGLVLGAQSGGAVVTATLGGFASSVAVSVR